MKALKNLMITIAVLSTSCAPKNQQEFDRYMNSLEELKLPADSTLSIPSNTYDSILWRKFNGNWGTFPCGKISYGDSVIMTVEIGVGDFLWPSLKTFDRLGHKLDSIRPYEKSGFGPGYDSHQHLLINEKGHIIVIDSTTTWLINSAGDDDVEEKKILMVDTVLYQVDNKGKFRKELE